MYVSFAILRGLAPRPWETQRNARDATPPTFITVLLSPADVVLYIFAGAFHG